MTRMPLAESAVPGPRLTEMDRRKGIGVLLCCCVLALASTAIAVGAVEPSTPTSSVRVTLGSDVVRLGQQATIAVSNVRAGSMQVLLLGGTGEFGKPLGWRSLRQVGGTWRGNLPGPAHLGIYPIMLRTGVGTPAFGSPQWLLRVFAPGARSQPSFADPADVVRWWVQSVPREELVAMKPWPFPDFDRRDRRLHRLFVVAYAPAGDANVDDRLGTFVTAVRDGYQGRWRFLEATLEP